MDIKIDLSKATILDYMQFLKNSEKGDVSKTFAFIDKVVVGGIEDMPMSELPAIMSKLAEALQKNSDSAKLAVASMLNHLLGND